MDALDRLLTASVPRPCEACRFARATAHDGLYCCRGAVSPYPCTVERASSPIEARLYGACGSHGRFFERGTAPPPAWLTEDAIGSETHAALS